MSLVRKLCLLSAVVLVALGLMAASVAAQGVTVLEEEADDTNHACATLEPAAETTPTPSGATVTGGCHLVVRTEGNVALIAHTVGGPVEQSNCEVSAEVRMDGNGEGYVVAWQIDAPHPPSAVGCTRTPCDGASGGPIAWPFHIREVTGVERVEITWCVRLGSADPGTPGIPCHMQIPWSALGDHAYEGDLNVACDNAPLTFIELAGQSITDTSNELEQIEIVH